MYSNNGTEYIDGENKEAVSKLLEGRKIVDVDSRKNTLVLDDGTRLEVLPNDGGCSCGAGDYWIDSLAKCDNIITRAEVLTRYIQDEWYETISIYVFAEGMQEKTEVVSVSGDEGSGYYGRGFEILVTRGTNE